MTYLILLFLGLCIGAVFLVVLLIGDKREARLEAQKRALQEQITVANEPIEGAWPPPPSAINVPQPSQLASPAKPLLAPGTSRKVIRAFSVFRYYAFGTVTAAYLIYACFPRFSFGWVLLVTVLAAVVLAIGITKFRKSENSNRV